MQDDLENNPEFTKRVAFIKQEVSSHRKMDLDWLINHAYRQGYDDGYVDSDRPKNKLKPKKRTQVTTIKLPCLYCHKAHEFCEDSNEAQGIFNVFCDNNCEDRYALTL